MMIFYHPVTQAWIRRMNCPIACKLSSNKHDANSVLLEYLIINITISSNVIGALLAFFSRIILNSVIRQLKQPIIQSPFS